MRAFNEMMQALEANSRELESRRQFTEAILESIPTGVISLTADGGIQRVNRALHGLFPEEQIEAARHLAGFIFAGGRHRDPLSDETRAAHRPGGQPDRSGAARARPPSGGDGLGAAGAAVPVIAPGFVLVLEDTSELLRAQKAAAWHEVARRIAHELKNPLTPDRAFRRTNRAPAGPRRLPAGFAAHPARVRRHHFARSGVGEDAGRRVLAVLALPRGATRCRAI